MDLLHTYNKNTEFPAVFFSPKQNFLLDEHIDYVKQINKILQTMPTDKLKDIYNIICVMNK